MLVFVLCDQNQCFFNPLCSSSFFCVTLKSSWFVTCLRDRICVSSQARKRERERKIDSWRKHQMKRIEPDDDMQPFVADPYAEEVVLAS